MASKERLAGEGHWINFRIRILLLNRSKLLDHTLCGPMRQEIPFTFSDSEQRVGEEKNLEETPFRFHPPRQERSRETLDRIATAALELVEEVGVSRTTVAAIVDRAQASVGSFYARFPGKEDLIGFLRRRVWGEARERWDQAVTGQAWDGVPMQRVIEGVVSLLARSLEADNRRRKLLARDGGLDPEAQRHALSFHRHVLSDVTRLLMERRREITHPEPEKAVKIGYWVVVGAIRLFHDMHQAIGLEPDGLEPDVALGFTGPEEVAPQLARLWVGFLRPGEGPGGSSGGVGVDFFDPWG
jgi:AcrR family transcriptional regulator